MATQRKSRRPTRVSRGLATSRLFDKLSNRTKAALMVAVGALMTVGAVGAVKLHERDKQARIVETSYKNADRRTKPHSYTHPPALKANPQSDAYQTDMMRLHDPPPPYS